MIIQQTIQDHIGQDSTKTTQATEMGHYYSLLHPSKFVQR